MAVHWKIQFTTLRSQRQLTVNIYDDSYTGDVIPLRGGAQPFVTVEDQSDDWFQPVRTQSGYIRIVDNGYDLNGTAFDWKDLIPATDLSHKVELTDGTDILWQGYMQPQTFAGRMYISTQEREYPVMCALSAIEGVDLDTDILIPKTFAELIDGALTATGLSWEYIYFSGTDADNWLQKSADYNNFIGKDDEGNRIAEYNQLTLLEEICRFWGWSCRTHGNSIYFLAPDENFVKPYIRYQDQDWYYAVHYKETGHYDTASYYDTVNLIRDVYASENNDVEILRGIKSAEVTADTNKQESIWQFASDVIRDEMDAGGYHVQAMTSNINLCRSNYFYYFSNNDETVSCVSSEYARLLLGERYTGEKLFHEPGQMEALMHISNPYTEGITPVSVVYKMPHVYDDGYFRITANIYGGAEKLADTRNMKMRLGVGYEGDVKWFDGSSWSSEGASFNVAIGQSMGIFSTKGFGTNYVYKPGINIAVPEQAQLNGQIFIEFLGSTNYGDYIDIGDFTIEFYRNTKDSKNNGSHVYKELSGAAFRDEVNISTIFASAHASDFGYGLIENAASGYMESASYTLNNDSGDYRPEERLATRMATRGASLKYKCKLDLRTELVDITPTTMVTTPNGTEWPVSIGYDWINDVTSIISIQL